MEISNYLVELITDKDQVTVPGLGKFLKKRKPGYYDDATKTYFPPSGEVVYTADYMHDDKLVHLISQRKETSLTAAYAILDEYIREIKLALKNNEVNLKGIGILKDNGGQISLTSETETNLNKAFFGLPAVDTLSAKLVGVETETYSLAQQALNTSIPDELFEQEPRRGVVAITMGIIAVVILAGVIALYFAKPDIYKKLVTQIQNYTISKPSATPIAPVEPQKESSGAIALQKADSIYHGDDIESKLKAEGFEVEKVKDSTNVSVKPKFLPKKGDIKYEIIIGLYTRREDAVKRVSQLKANGIDAHIVEDADGPMIKISCATLYNEADAIKEEARVREELNPEAFKKAIKILK
ncbi:HU domain-containing protein [Pedobacter arcticus]|uniref:HU domain-containing protein n=1 Tax=Pedobacter arcticus TaxID=752140 RepID=UPI00031639D7|nr:HU-CCDC81 and SPOR domain-containing protein [Pedobacter arcticus]